MKFVRPVVPGSDLPEIELASSQPEFETLPVVHCGFGVMLCRAELDDADLEEINRTRSIYLFQVTGGKPPNPIILDAFRPEIKPDTGAPGIPREGYLTAPMVVSVSIIGGPNDTAEEARSMIRAVEGRFSPPFRFAGYSLKVTFDRVTPVHPTVAAKNHPSLKFVFAAASELLSALIESKGLPISVENFCVLIASGAETFLLDAKVYYLATGAPAPGSVAEIEADRETPDDFLTGSNNGDGGSVH